jgi:hypothetical protein
MAMDLSRLRLGNFVCTWDTYDFGGVDKVKPKVSLKLHPVKVGSIGDLAIDDRIIGLDVDISIEAREIDLVLYKKLAPWYTTGSVALTPSAVHTRLYQYAKALKFHPNDPEVGTLATQDYNFIKAVPLFNPMERDGETDDVVLTGFKVYPDQSQLPLLIYGYIGDAP